uniref:BTB domain-containing protein n=1 Tax=Panagrolaimus davidi TaxID=227884 RepID=A0A914P6K0_9BILA
MQLQIFDAFKSQNPELFDVVFEIEGKKVYAHKFPLSIISTTFESMLSDRWISKNNAIKIESHKYDDFKEFLKFLYSGECQLSDENIITMIDIAEFYQVNSFKKYCGEYLSKITLNIENIIQITEASHKYSMLQMKKPIQGFLIKNFKTFVKSDEFLNANEFIIKQFVKMEPNNDIKTGGIFQAVYELAKNQANMKNESDDENLNDPIKAEITPFLQLIKFIVKITNSDGNSICGNLQNKSAIDIIETLKNRESNNSYHKSIFWKTECKKPSTPCPLKQRDDVKWYLFYFPSGAIGVLNSSEINQNTYLLAEMVAETDFKITQKCKIEIE